MCNGALETWFSALNSFLYMWSASRTATRGCVGPNIHTARVVLHVCPGVVLHVCPGGGMMVQVCSGGVPII